MLPNLLSSTGWQQHEHAFLAAYAAKSDGPMTQRRHPEPDHPYRTSFQRDRDRIIHAQAFRRLKHKRQVFLITYGDHFRTRLTHTLEVAQIARTMARALRLNEDLVEAVALGHDLGHTPFGHLGEVVLDEILQGRDPLDGTFSAGRRGGFKHNYQSLRIVDRLEQKYELPGLNLTAAVREGILKHTRLKRQHYSYPDLDLADLHFNGDFAATIEGQLVAMADEVAQRTHDLEDGIRAGLVHSDEVRTLEIVRLVEAELKLERFLPQQGELYVRRLIGGLIELFVTDIIEETCRRAETSQQRSRVSEFSQVEVVAFSADVDPLQKALNKFIYERIIFVPSIREPDKSARELLRGLFRVYWRDPQTLPADYLVHRPQASDGDEARAIADFIAGMTDHYAIAEASRLQKDGLLSSSLDLQALLPHWVIRVS